MGFHGGCFDLSVQQGNVNGAKSCLAKNRMIKILKLEGAGTPRAAIADRASTSRLLFKLDTQSDFFSSLQNNETSTVQVLFLPSKFVGKA